MLEASVPTARFLSRILPRTFRIHVGSLVLPLRRSEKILPFISRIPNLRAMKLYMVKIQLESPMLGDQQDNDGVHRFERSKKEGWILTDMDRWHYALSEATTTLDLASSLAASQIRVDLEWRAPSLHRYVKTRRDPKTGAARETTFECIRTGTMLTFEVAALESPEPDSIGLRGPDAEELTEILRVVGKYVGISPWGSRFGFGRFTVRSIHETKHRDHDPLG